MSGIEITNRVRPCAAWLRAKLSLSMLLCLAVSSFPLPLDATAMTEEDSAKIQTRPVPWHPDAGRDASHWKRNLFKRWGGDQRYLLTTWWKEEFSRFGFALPFALTTALAASSGGSKPGLDERLARSLRGGDGGRDNELAKGFSRLSDTKTAVAFLAGTYLLSRWSGSENLARSSSLATEALLSAGLWNVALKRLARRTRPVADGQGEFFVSQPAEGQTTNSFPSGHAMGAFAVATVFASEYRDKRWVPWITYTTACLIGASRVSLGRHFPSDVVAGALLGHSIGRMVTTRQRGSDGERTHRLQPVFDPGAEGYGIKYVHSW